MPEMLGALDFVIPWHSVSSFAGNDLTKYRGLEYFRRNNSVCR